MTEEQLDLLPSITIHNGHMDRGAYGMVYRIDPDRIVKVSTRKDVTIDELEGSKLSKYALPVLETVRVKDKFGKFIGYGLIKEYIPHTTTYQESADFCGKMPKLLQIDCRNANVRKDEEGNMYLVDTQTCRILTNCT